MKAVWKRTNAPRRRESRSSFTHLIVACLVAYLTELIYRISWIDELVTKFHEYYFYPNKTHDYEPYIAAKGCFTFVFAFDALCFCWQALLTLKYLG